MVSFECDSTCLNKYTVNCTGIDSIHNYTFFLCGVKLNVTVYGFRGSGFRVQGLRVQRFRFLGSEVQGSGVEGSEVQK